MTISLRLSDNDGQLFKQYAALCGLSISELIRVSVLEHIEQDCDLQAYRQALDAYAEDPSTYSLSETEKEMGFR